MGAGEATWHIYEGFGYGAIHKALEPKFLKLGGELLTSTAAVALKLNEDGSKTITLRNEADGTTEDVTAKVVVLAAGGYLNNKEMMAEETDYDLSRMVPVSSGKGTGDGLRLGWSVGGRKWPCSLAATWTTLTSLTSRWCPMMSTARWTSPPASSLTGDTYGPNMPGTCAGYAFYSGRNAALDAQKYL